MEFWEHDSRRQNSLVIGQSQRVRAVKQLGKKRLVSYVGTALEVHVYGRLPVSR